MGEVSRFDSRLRIFFIFFFLVSGDQLAHTNSTFLGQDQSPVAQRVEMTVAGCCLTYARSESQYLFRHYTIVVPFYLCVHAFVLLFSVYQ